MFKKHGLMVIILIINLISKNILLHGIGVQLFYQLLDLEILLLKV